MSNSPEIEIEKSLATGVFWSPIERQKNKRIISEPFPKYHNEKKFNLFLIFCLIYWFNHVCQRFSCPAVDDSLCSDQRGWRARSKHPVSEKEGGILTMWLMDNIPQVIVFTARDTFVDSFKNLTSICGRQMDPSDGGKWMLQAGCTPENIDFPPTHFSALRK